MKKELLTKSLIGLVVAVIMVGCVWQGLSWFGKIGEDTIAKATTEQSTTQDAETNRNDESSLEAEGSQAAGTEETEAVTTIAMTEDEETESSTETTESIETTGKESTVTETTKSKATKAAKAEGSASKNTKSESSASKTTKSESSASKTTKKAESSAAVKTTEAVSSTQTPETVLASEESSSQNTEETTPEGETTAPEDKVSDESLFEYVVYGDIAHITAYLGNESKVIIPETLGGKTVWAISYCSFENNEGIISVVVPSGCTMIDNGAFSGCKNLKSVILPEGLTRIGYGAFRDCKSLAEISLPSSIGWINDYAFMNTGLTSVEIPDSLVDRHDFSSGIGEYAFGYNGDVYELDKIDGFNIIGSEGSEAHNYALKYGLWFNGKEAEGFSWSLEDNGRLYVTGYTGKDTEVVIPAKLNGMAVFGVRGFELTDQLKKVVISKGISVIDQYAFLGSSIEEIVIPDSVIYIGKYAFLCTKLKEVEIPASVVRIESAAFGAATSYVFAEELIGIEDYAEPTEASMVQYMNPEFNIKGTAGSMAEQYAAYNGLLFNGAEPEVDYVFQSVYCTDGDYDPYRTDVDFYSVKKYCGKDGDIVIPSNYQGRPVKSIKEGAFRNCESLTSVEIPGEIQYIYTSAFYGCTSLSRVVLNEGTAFIYNGAFSSCPGLTEVEIPESTRLGDYCFGYIFSIYPTWDVDWYSEPDASVEGFNIVGVQGSDAEEYAKANHFLFNGNEV